MKKFTAMVCAAFLALSLTACGSSSNSSSQTKEVSIDTDKLAQELLETVTSDTLAKSSVDPSTIYFYDTADVESAVSYASSGTTACEVAVIESKDASNTEEIEKLLQTRVDNQKELYASYNAAEADKLDDAIIESTGKYTVLCVSDDQDKAKEILKEYGF